MALLFLRLIGGLMATLALCAVAVGLLLWDARSHVLYGWDSVRLGYWVMLALALVGSAIGRKSLVLHLSGLDLVLRSGLPATRAHRAVRSLLFWLMLASPGVFGIGMLISQLPLSERQRILCTLAAVLAIVLLPAVSILCTGGRSSIHDLLVGTCVYRRKAGFVLRHRDQWRAVLSRVVATYCGLVALLLLLGMAVDWRYRVTDVYGAYFRAREPYMSEVARSLRLGGSDAQDIVAATPPTEYYANEDFTAIVPGLTERFRFRVSPHILDDPIMRRLAVYEGMITVSHTMTPGTKWVAMRIYSTRGGRPTAS